MSAPIIGPFLLMAMVPAVLAAAIMVTDRVRTGDWDWSSWLILATAVGPSSGKILGELTAPGRRYVSVWTNESVYIQSPWVGTLTTIAAIGLTITGSLIFWHRRLRFPPARISLVAATLWGTAMLATLSGSFSVGSQHEALALLSLLLAAGTASRPRAVAAGVTLAGVIITAASVATVTLQPDTALAACRPDKCGPFGWLVTGALGNENELGLLLAACIPFAAIGVRRPTDWVLVWYLFAMAVATGSRTATFAAIAITMVAVVYRPRFGHRRALGGLTTAAVLLLVLGLVLPYTGQQLDAFSGRGRIWTSGQELLASRPIFGMGTQSWQTEAFDPGASYSMHNQLLDVRYVAGIVGLLLFLYLLVAIVRWSSERPALLLVIASVGALGVLERPWSIGRLDWLSFLPVAAIAIAASTEPSRDSKIGPDQARVHAGP